MKKNYVVMAKLKKKLHWSNRMTKKGADEYNKNLMEKTGFKSGVVKRVNPELTKKIRKLANKQ